MIKIKNTHKEDISIIFEGKEYSIEAGKSLDVKDEVASFWKKVHLFIEIEKVKGKVKKKEKEENVEEKVEVKKEEKAKKAK